MSCNKCGGDKKIVNKHFNLCLECNNLRLHGSKYGKQYTYIPKKFPLRRASRNKSISIRKKIEKISKDENFYKECFDSVEIHKCEECGVKLPSEFKYEDTILARWRYSHVIAKSIAPHLRHVIRNINHLCFKCHYKWDHGDKRSMKIYEKNKKSFPEYLD